MGGERDSIEKTLWMESDAIGDAFRNLDIQVAEDVIGKINACTGNIILSGAGTSGAAARKIAYTLNCIEQPAVFMDPSEALHGRLGLVRCTRHCDSFFKRRKNRGD